MHEFELINKYFSKLSSSNKSSLDLNDDVFFDKSKKLVISVDTYVEGVHFINFQNPDLVIKKIIIKEYLIASNFFLDNSQTKYLNALLDNIAKKIR